VTGVTGSVHLFFCDSKSYEWILVKFFSAIGQESVRFWCPSESCGFCIIQDISLSADRALC